MATIKLDADARAALAEYEKLSQKTDDLADGQEKLAGKSRETAAEERRLGSLRRRLLEDSETAQERYTRKLNLARKALDGTGTSEEQLGRIRDRLGQEYEKDLRDQEQGLGRFKDKLAEVEEQSEEAFDEGPIAGWTASLTTATAIANGVVQVLQNVRQAADEAGERLAAISGSSGNLVQLAGGDSALRDRLFEASDRLFLSGFVEDREAANAVVFELQSGNKLDDLKFFGRLNTIEDSASLAKSIGLLEAGFRGGDDVGTPQEVVSKALAAAAPATGVSVADILEGAASAAAAAKPFGITDEELIASTSLVSQITGSGSEAGTQIRELLSSLTRRGLADDLRGQGFPAILQAVREVTNSNAERIEFLGGATSARAFSPLENPQQFRKRLSEIVDAQANLTVEATIDNALASERVSLEIARRAAEAEDDLRGSGSAELRGDIAQARARGGARARFGDIGADVIDTTANAVRFVPGGSSFLNYFLPESAARPNDSILEMRSTPIEQAIKEQTKAIAEQTNVIKQQRLGIPVK